MARKIIHIEHLDEGYAVEQNGRQKGFGDWEVLRSYLQHEFSSMIKLLDAGVHNHLIVIEVDTNTPI